MITREAEALPREYDRARADELWRDLIPDEVTWRPREDFSLIGWHLGHQAHVARFMVRDLTAAEPRPGPVGYHPRAAARHPGGARQSRVSSRTCYRHNG